MVSVRPADLSSKRWKQLDCDVIEVLSVFYLQSVSVFSLCPQLSGCHTSCNQYIGFDIDRYMNMINCNHLLQDFEQQRTASY